MRNPEPAALTALRAKLGDAAIDDLLERICLTGICIGALGLAYEVCKTQTVSSSITWLSVCAAGYALEVGRKYK